MTQHIPSLMQRTSKTIIKIDYTKARNKYIAWQRLASVADYVIVGLALGLLIISYLVSEF